jgi:hypothetical protein
MVTWPTTITEVRDSAWKYGLPKPCKMDSPSQDVRWRAKQSPSSRLAIRPFARKQHPS